MQPRKFFTYLAFLVTAMAIPPLMADVPYIFTNGEPALAEQVNANFSALLDEIEALQSQIDELNITNQQGSNSSASVVGDWVFVSIGSNFSDYQDDGYSARNQISYSASTLTEDGTYTSIESVMSQNLTIDNDISASCSAIGVMCFFKSYIGAEIGGNVQESASYSGTYSVEGSDLIIDLGGGRTAQASISADGNVMLFSKADGDGLSIGIGMKL